MCKKLFVSILVISSLLFMHSAFASKSAKTLTIGILEPVEINAMTEIVKGFKKEISKEVEDPNSSLYGYNVSFVVENAQGESGTQNMILKQFNEPKIDIVAPIGTSAMQAAMVTITDNKPIVAIDPNYNKEMAVNARNQNVTYNMEGIKPKDQFVFIRRVMRNKNKTGHAKPFRRMAFVYSDSAHIVPYLRQVRTAARGPGQVIKLNEVKIEGVASIGPAARTIKNDNQAIFILEDEPVVSGVDLLIHQAERLHIPVITSDEGSVKSGAAFALGVSQYDMGSSAAKLVAEVVKHHGNAKLVKPVSVNKFTVYINRESALRQGVNPDVVEATAQRFGYSVVDK